MCVKARKALYLIALRAIIFELPAVNRLRFTAGYTLEGVWGPCM